jgi:hypothetical protein
MKAEELSPKRIHWAPRAAGRAVKLLLHDDTMYPLFCLKREIPLLKGRTPVFFQSPTSQHRRHMCYVGPLKHTQARLDSRAGTKFKLVADERAVCVTGYSAFSRACSPVCNSKRSLDIHAPGARKTPGQRSDLAFGNKVRAP